MGSLPPRQTKLVLAWAEIHKDELLVDWELASNWNLPGSGKRGALRVIYYWSPPDIIFMLFPYRKNEQEDLTTDQLKLLREMVKELLS